MPLLLLIVVGTIWASLLVLQASRLDHIAREAATAGAMDADPCPVALEAAERLSAPSSAIVECFVADGVVTVELRDSLPVPPLLDALMSGVIDVSASAIIREEAP